MKWLYLTAFLVALTPAHAGVYRCVEGDSVSFSDRPCPAQFQQKPPVSSDGMAAAERNRPLISAETEASPPEAEISQEPVASQQAAPTGISPPESTRRSQLVASIAVAETRLDRLINEKQLAMDAFGQDYSLDAQVLAHHYSTVIRPLRQELEEMKSQLAGSQTLSAQN